MFIFIFIHHIIYIINTRNVITINHPRQHYCSDMMKIYNINEKSKDLYVCLFLVINMIMKI